MISRKTPPKLDTGLKELVTPSITDSPLPVKLVDLTPSAPKLPKKEPKLVRRQKLLWLCHGLTLTRKPHGAKEIPSAWMLSKKLSQLPPPKRPNSSMNGFTN
jgi:hypothetical protein